MYRFFLVPITIRAVIIALLTVYYQTELGAAQTGKPYQYMIVLASICIVTIDLLYIIIAKVILN